MTATAPAVMALVTFSMNVMSPRRRHAMFPAADGGNSPAFPRPQLMIGRVIPCVMPDSPSALAGKVSVVRTHASEKPWPAGTDDRMLTPGADTSSPLPVFEKSGC